MNWAFSGLIEISWSSCLFPASALFKESWFFLLENYILKPRAECYMCSLLLKCDCSRPSQWTKLGKVCSANYAFVHVYESACLCACVYLHVCGSYHKFIQVSPIPVQYHSIHFSFSSFLTCIYSSKSEKFNSYYQQYI